VLSVMQPHCDADLASVAAEAAPQTIDIVVTPVVNQELIAYPLVNSHHWNAHGSNGVADEDDCTMISML
jgi:hypothetical protein